jgi:hypothetical protein
MVFDSHIFRYLVFMYQTLTLPTVTGKPYYPFLQAVELNATATILVNPANQLSFFIWAFHIYLSSPLEPDTPPPWHPWHRQADSIGCT